jgi:hypothetical protein
MSTPAGWRNPITAPAGHRQLGVDPHVLLPSRRDLIPIRLDLQRSLLRVGKPRATPILVTREGVIVDGHHAVRAAAEAGLSVDVLVCDQSVAAYGATIVNLPLR